jgi:hypothetical protein
LVKKEPDIRMLPGAQISHADVVVFVTSRLNGKILGVCGWPAAVTGVGSC